jgi:hypothetical protein
MGPEYHCNDCNMDLDEEDVTRCSLDAHADLSEDFDLICELCGNNSVVELNDN